MALKAAVIGLGSMGTNHARVYSSLRSVELVGCADVSKNTSDVASKFNTNFYTNYRELLKKESPALVSICVPTTLHKKVALDCFSQNSSALVEKPISADSKSAQTIISAAKKAKAKLMIGHVERFNPVIQGIKKYLSSSSSKIFSINIERVGPIPPRIKDVGVVLDLGTHDIDLATFLTGQKVKQVYCTTNSYTNPSKHEDSAHLTLELSNNISVSITTNWLTPYKQRTIEVITDKSVVQGNLKEQELIEFTKNGNSYLSNSIEVNKSEPLVLELQSFADS